MVRAALENSLHGAWSWDSWVTSESVSVAGTTLLLVGSLSRISSSQLYFSNLHPRVYEREIDVLPPSWTPFRARDWTCNPGTCPCLGIEPEALLCMGWHFNHWVNHIGPGQNFLINQLTHIYLASKMYNALYEASVRPEQCLTCCFSTLQECQLGLLKRCVQVASFYVRITL